MIKSNNFGYTKVTNTQKTKLVQKVFSDVASNYDLFDLYDRCKMNLKSKLLMNRVLQK